MLSIWVDACDRPALTVAIDLDTLLWLDGGRVWIGITAASRAAYENHWLTRWCFSYSDVCGCAAPPDPIIIDSVRHDTLLVERHDTVYIDRHDTIRVTTTDTLRLVQRDTLTLTRIDTVVRTETVVVHDTTIIRSTDTLRLPVRDTVVRYDTIPCDTPTVPVPDCDGSWRELQMLEFWRGIVAVEPNPATNHLVIDYEIAVEGTRTLTLYDAQGRLASVLLSAPAAAGRYRLDVDVGHLPSGHYILRLDANGVRYHRTVIIQE
jgi:hypothetical protein